MRVAIAGAGAVGCLLGGMLARAGHAVVFVARGESILALKEHGVAITSPKETFTAGPFAATDDPTTLGRCDLVLVGVKTWQVEALAPSLAPLVGEDTIVVPTQNGVEASDHLASALGAKAVIGGICHVLATRTAPGHVRYAAAPPTLILGERDGSATPRIAHLASALRAAGIPVTETTEIGVALWSKLLFVEPLGSVGAVTRASAEIVRAIPETRAMLVGAMREVQAVAAARGVRVPDAMIDQALARIDGMPAGATASMHRDLIEGRPSELAEQTGAVARLGKQEGVPCPLHDFLFASLLPQDPRLRLAAASREAM